MGRLLLRRLKSGDALTLLQSMSKKTRPPCQTPLDILGYVAVLAGRP
jgi:hypothetical protein